MSVKEAIGKLAKYGIHVLPLVSADQVGTDYSLHSFGRRRLNSRAEVLVALRKDKDLYTIHRFGDPVEDIYLARHIATWLNPRSRAKKLRLRGLKKGRHGRVRAKVRAILAHSHSEEDRLNNRSDPQLSYDRIWKRLGN